MAVCRRVAARSLLLSQKALTQPTVLHTRAFTSLNLCSQRSFQNSIGPQRQPRRSLHDSQARSITGQEAPSAQAYIKSGVISGKKELVDVKKVLVIGSGGLSIGQAGEFDYSGALRATLKILITSHFLSILSRKICLLQTTDSFHTY